MPNAVSPVERPAGKPTKVQVCEEFNEVFEIPTEERSKAVGQVKSSKVSTAEESGESDPRHAPDEAHAVASKI